MFILLMISVAPLFEDAIVDMNRALNYPTSQFEGDKELERGMKKARVGPPDSYIYTKYHGVVLLECQHHLEMNALIDRQAKEKLEFEALAKEASEHKTLIDLFNQDNFEADIFQEFNVDEE